MAGLVDATDLMLRQFTSWWAANAGAVVTPLPAIVNEATEADLNPHPRDTGLPWVRITVRHATGNPVALGSKLHGKTGDVFIQIFVPFKNGAAYTVAQRLAEVAKNAYEGKRAGGVSFPSVAVQEKGREGSWYRCDCVVGFDYHERKTT